ncbi:MAG: peptide chain release factor N(5)-glutamine methyltransferase [Bacteroidia bacterium]
MRIAGNTLSDIKRYFDTELSEEYDVSERLALFRLVAGEINGFSMLHLHLNPNDRVNESDLITYSQWVKRLKNFEPIQYITGKSWFMDLELEVNPSVLIPRPETEELVNFILIENPSKEVRIIDACSGSGCIALALKHYLPQANVSGFDISEAAIETAKKNAKKNALDVLFFHADLLNEVNWVIEGEIDILVSNPPYIPQIEKSNLAKHVYMSEPEIALFVADEDPLIFYRHLGNLAKRKLKAGGLLVSECHQDFTTEVADLWKKMGLANPEIHYDLSGNPRFVSVKNSGF